MGLNHKEKLRNRVGVGSRAGEDWRMKKVLKANTMGSG